MIVLLSLGTWGDPHALGVIGEEMCVLCQHQQLPGEHVYLQALFQVIRDLLNTALNLGAGHLFCPGQ